MGRVFVYCRVWTGFTSSFPLERFRGIGEDALLPALRKAADEEGPPSAAIREWAEESNRRVMRGQIHGPGKPADPPVEATELTPGLKQWAAKRAKTPDPAPDTLPLTSDVMLLRKLQALGWIQGPILWSRSFAKRHILAAANSIEDANTVSQALAIQFKESGVLEFGVIASNEVTDAERLLCEREAAKGGMARGSDSSDTLASCARVARDLLDSLRRRPAIKAERPDTQADANPFDNVEPHRYLPDGARSALWGACKLVLARPSSFAGELTWLNDGYSERAVRERMLRDSEQTYKSQLRHLRAGCDRCDTFPRRRVLRASRPELGKSRRLELLRQFWSVPDIGGVSPGFAKELVEHPEKVREWVVQLTIHTALLRGRRIEGDKVATRNAANENNLVDASNVEVVWRCLDAQCRQSVQRIKADRRERDERYHQEARDRVKRLRRAVSDVTEAGLPAGKDEQAHARRVVLLACLLSYQYELPMAGEFATWPWNSEGHPLATLVGGTYIPGRQSVLFSQVSRESCDAGLVEVRDFDALADLVRRAVDVLSSGDQGAMGGISARAGVKDDPARRQTASAPTSEPSCATYTIAAVLEMAGLSNTTLNHYAKLAGVKTPRRGKRNHLYTTDEVRNVLQTIIDKTSDRSMKDRCRRALAKL